MLTLFRYRIEKMETKEFNSRLKEFFVKNDHYASLSDIEVIEVAEGHAKVQVRIQQKHLNGVRIAHGGIIFTLADVAFGLASNSHKKVAVSLNSEISFFSPAEEGQLIIAEAELLILRKTVANYLINVKNEDGELLAMMKAQAYRKNGSIENYI